LVKDGGAISKHKTRIASWKYDIDFLCQTLIRQKYDPH
jgi:hypothetical protein